MFLSNLFVNRVNGTHFSTRLINCFNLYKNIYSTFIYDFREVPSFEHDASHRHIVTIFYNANFKIFQSKLWDTNLISASRKHQIR